MEVQERENPLGTLPIPRLLLKFAIPSIVAMLVSALYDIGPTSDFLAAAVAVLMVRFEFQNMKKLQFQSQK